MYRISCCLILVLFLTNCKKSEYCAENLSLQAPASVVEGETIMLSVKNSISGANTYYYWTFPDMTPYSSTVGGAVEVSDDGPRFIEHADFRDDGEYTFTINPGDDKCSVAHDTKIVHVIPKTCPCYDELGENYLEINKSWLSGTFVQDFTPIFEETSFNDGFQVLYSMPMFTYQLEVHFETPAPHHSSTYALRNYYQNGLDGMEDDPPVQAWITFVPAADSYNTYRVVEGAGNLYVKYENNQLVLSFCDLVFTHTSDPNKTIRLSGKARVDL
ncbi:MAG: hypothetical protein ACO1O6_00090 [Bacteroidota bacterium]